MDINALFSLEGRVALVTGGSRGIGAMIAEGFLAAGCARVYITARKAAAVADTATRLGERCIALPGDISTIAGIEALVAELATREEKLDILVNNAGITRDDIAFGMGCALRYLSRGGVGQGHGP